MKIHETRRDLHNPDHPQQMLTAVMIENAANDVAVYWMAGDIDAETVAARGHKMTKSEALACGFKIPPGTLYAEADETGTNGDPDGMNAAPTATNWLVLRWQESPSSHGTAAWWHHRHGSWTQDRDLATPLEKAEAEQLADDWNDYAASKGRPERYRAEPAPTEASAASAALSL